MEIPRTILYAGERFRIQTTGRYYQSGRKGSPERLLHRRIWIDNFGAIPEGFVVHHKDGDWTNNRIENLREATPTQNNWNAKGKARSKSHLKGVSWSKQLNKWIARIRIGGGKRLHLGVFETPELAHRAYANAAQIHHGNFARV